MQLVHLKVQCSETERSRRVRLHPHPQQVLLHVVSVQGWEDLF